MITAKTETDIIYPPKNITFTIKIISYYVKNRSHTGIIKTF